MEKKKLSLYLLSLIFFIPIIVSAAKDSCIVEREILDIEEDDDFWLYDDDDDDDYGFKAKKANKVTYQYSIMCENVILNGELSLQSQISGNHKEESTQASVITFKNCTLATVSVAFFKDMEAVTKLDLSNSSISSIEPGALKMPNLIILRLANNNLTEIKEGTIKELSKVTEINLDSNKISTFESFKNCEKLTGLYLGSNNITTINEEHFKNLDALNFLDLSNNNISVIQPNAFASLVHLSFIELQYNALETLPGVFNKEKDLSSLRTINLSHNHLKEISFTNLTYDVFATRFYYFIKRELNLGYNNFTLVPANLSNMYLLAKSLYLNNNNINTIFANDFNGMNMTNFLYLSNNIIDTIEIGAFRDFARLLTLDLSSNKLKEIKTGVFTGLNNINYLNLSYNDFIHFDATPLYTMATLNELSFTGNYLHSLNTSEFHFHNLKYISLDFHVISCHTLSKYMKAFTSHGINVRNGSTYLTENLNGIACNHSIHKSTTTVAPTTTTSTTTVSSTTLPVSAVTTTESTTVAKDVTAAPVTSVVTETNVIEKSEVLEKPHTGKTSHTILIVTIVLLLASATGVAVWFGRKYYYKRNLNSEDSDAQYRLVNILEETEKF